MSTLTLRGALATLRERGLVVTRRGRAGGSFVARHTGGAENRSALAALTTRQLRELRDVRQAVGGTAAALAAHRATGFEIKSLRRRVERLGAATAVDERRRADSEFAIGIAAAAQSPRLAQQEANLRAELGDLVWAVTGDMGHVQSVQARRALVEAIADGDAADARRLAEEQVEQEARLLMRWRIDLYGAEAER